MNNKGKSKAALVIAGLYMLVVVAAFIVMLATSSDTAMSGIFLVMLTPPWPLALGALQKILQTDSSLFASLFLLAGGAVNSAVLYRIIALVAARVSRSG
jgi:hypothetical protein